jgi:hypothetical protein
MWSVCYEGEKVRGFETETEARKFAAYANAEFATADSAYYVELR